MNHLDDDAELHALGLTSPERAAEIEAHITECDACRARVVAAEAVAASLAATLPPIPVAAPSRRPWWPALATAAAVIFAFAGVIEGNAARTADRETRRTSVALTAIASSHFSHATLVSERSVVAKALYARNGAWCYIIATGGPVGAHVVVHRGAAARDAGVMGPGAPSTLFIQDLGWADEVDVVAGGRVVAHGKLVY